MAKTAKSWSGPVVNTPDSKPGRFVVKRCSSLSDKVRIRLHPKFRTIKASDFMFFTDADAKRCF